VDEFGFVTSKYSVNHMLQHSTACDSRLDTALPQGSNSTTDVQQLLLAATVRFPEACNALSVSTLAEVLCFTLCRSTTYHMCAPLGPAAMTCCCLAAVLLTGEHTFICTSQRRALSLSQCQRLWM
jgi:hypothetical protein